MGLPLLNTSKQVITIPSTGKTYKVRPWLVGEEKGLLMAKESDDESVRRQSIIDLVENCVDDVKFEDLSSFEFEYLFLQLRRISVNNMIEIGLKHSCGEVNKVNIDLNSDLKVSGGKVEKKIILEEDRKVGVVMREPTAKNFESMAKLGSNTEKAFHLLRTSIESIFDAEEIYDPAEFTPEELNQWINSLNRDQLNKIYLFFENLPQVSVDVKYKCTKCGGKVEEKLRGLDSFLLSA